MNAPQPGAIIVLDHVTKRFGEKTVLEDLNFDVKEGEIFGFIGPSGSGKTTTIRLMTGVIEPTEGNVVLMGVNPVHSAAAVRQRFGYLPQLFVLYPNLTVRENLNFAGSLYGIGPLKRRKRIKELLDFVELSDAANRVAANVSGGMLRRLELAASLLHDPPLLFADEPTAGIDPVLRGKFWEEFRDLRQSGRTIFVTTQYVGEIEYCDRVGIIREGRIVAVDTPVGLRRLALGGELVDVTAENVTPSLLQSLSRLPFMAGHPHPLASGALRLPVQEASEAIPQIVEFFNSSNVPVAAVEEYKPTFDEVFIQLMNRDERMRSGGADARVS